MGHRDQGRCGGLKFPFLHSTRRCPERRFFSDAVHTRLLKIAGRNRTVRFSLVSTDALVDCTAGASRRFRSRGLTD